MFKFSSSGGSVNYRNEIERENLNSEIETFQQNHGECASFKELFERILKVANSQELPIEPITVIPDNYVKIADIGDLDERNQFFERLELIRKSYDFTADAPSKVLLRQAIESALSPKSTPDIKEVPVELPENAMIIQFSDDPKRPIARKMEILQAVQTNRQKKYNLPVPESLSSVVEKLVFSEGALFNHGGDVHTGF
nr:hypothetical protein [uncultured Fluviicola sp.]